MASSNESSEDGVYELLTGLCNNIASKYSSQNRISQKRLASKMRTHSYEIMLKKTTQEIPKSDKDPMVDLLSLYFVAQRTARNVAEFKRCTELKRVISTIRRKDFGKDKDNVHNVLKFLVGMSNSVKEDLSSEMYQSPFSFGVLNEMLPRPPRESFGSPQPYAYYPSHVFELPFSLRRQGGALDSPKSQTYTVESFDSKSLLADTASHMRTELKTFLSPMSLASMTSTHMSPYSERIMMNYPRLTGPRDLLIPSSTTTEPNVKVSLVSTNAKTDMKEVFRASNDEESLDIWELATQIDKDVPDDIWDIVSKLPPICERQPIASSTRELALWKRLYAERMSQLEVITEKQFVRHIMYLLIGVETSSFPYSPELDCFLLKEGLALEGVSLPRLRRFAATLMLIGTYYRRLYNFAFNHSLDDHNHNKGLVYEAAREVIRRYLLSFRLRASALQASCGGDSHPHCAPTLLQLARHADPLHTEIETVASVYRMVEPVFSESRGSIPHGAELMSYLFSEISTVTHRETAHAMFTSLFAICQVYFKFIERFIFEGELDDPYQEFFIVQEPQYARCRSKRYWDRGYRLAPAAVPAFLRALARPALLCGKSLRLLKLCNPSDPLVLLISSDHPSIKCCRSFAELERQQQVLDVYRTRCLFVSGEPATFTQIMLKRDAEKKAFAEMASVKQAETMEKIVAERKRLAQLIVAEKQHSLRVLEAAMAEAQAAKLKARQRERHRCKLEREAEAATEEVDARLRDSERDKIMEYYSKLNIEVEKSKMHTEWKIKRLQLDQSRMLLLSTEERNLKREKLELEHQRNEEMAMSIQSIDYNNDEYEKEEVVNIIDPKMTESGSSVEMGESSHENDNQKSSNDMFSVICNAAKSIFGVSKSEEKNCDNKKNLDAQGNILAADGDKELTTSSEVIGNNLDSNYDNLQFLRMRQEAYLNKQKVMAHEFGRIDEENNQMKDPPLVTPPLDGDNNVEEPWSAFAEAKRNKLKVLGAEFGILKPEVKPSEPRTDAQKEALVNKQKVLGVEYNVPIEFTKREPATEAQEEALKIRQKVLGSEYEKLGGSPRRERSGLTLDLKPYAEPPTTLPVTPNTAVTPGEFYSRLDLETPTTAEVPLESAMTNDMFTPRSDASKDVLDSKNTEKPFISTEGFNFPVIDDDVAESEVISDLHTEDSPENSPSKSIDLEVRNLKHKYSFFNLLDESYNLDEFDPFGVKGLKNYTKDHFHSKMDMMSSCYTHPAVIMEEVKKPPYSNIFASHLEEDKDDDITTDNIATLTACLQRSVLLPLTYQLEVVNNSILTYFLVNLDLYEHLKCLKDYFFLMDGEFSRSICHNLFTKLSKTVNPQELLNFSTLHNILDKALGSSISHVQKFTDNLSFTITDPPLSLAHSSPDALQCISLTYSAAWPLRTLLPPEALLRYARVFRLLIKTRRVAWLLGEDFKTLKAQAKTSPGLARAPHYRAVQVYRHGMAALLRALDNYIVTTCILTSWTEFENDLKKARTLDDLYECHVAYIKKVLFRCLLNNRSAPVMKLLNDLFTVVLKFSRVLNAHEWQQLAPNGPYTHPSFAQLHELHHLFEKLCKYLHKVVAKLTECGYQRHLGELLAMVDLSGYYDTAKDTSTAGQ